MPPTSLVSKILAQQSKQQPKPQHRGADGRKFDACAFPMNADPYCACQQVRPPNSAEHFHHDRYYRLNNNTNGENGEFSSLMHGMMTIIQQQQQILAKLDSSHGPARPTKSKPRKSLTCKANSDATSGIRLSQLNELIRDTSGDEHHHTPNALVPEYVDSRIPSPPMTYSQKQISTKQVKRIKDISKMEASRDSLAEDPSIWHAYGGSSELD